MLERKGSDGILYVLRLDRKHFYPKARLPETVPTVNNPRYYMETTVNDIPCICYDSIIVPKVVCECLLLSPNGKWDTMDDLAPFLNAIGSVEEFVSNYYSLFMRRLEYDTERDLRQDKEVPSQAVKLITAYRTRHSVDNASWREHLSKMPPSEFLRCLVVAGNYFRSLVSPMSPSMRLHKTYTDCCEDYRRRLCDMWGVIHSETRWIDGRVGWDLSVLYWKDPIPMHWVAWFVENCVTEDEWLSYLDYCDNEINSGKSTPSISFYRWFDDGERPLPVDKNYD